MTNQGQNWLKMGVEKRRGEWSIEVGCPSSGRNYQPHPAGRKGESDRLETKQLFHFSRQSFNNWVTPPPLGVVPDGWMDAWMDWLIRPGNCKGSGPCGGVEKRNLPPMPLNPLLFFDPFALSFVRLSIVSSTFNLPWKWPEIDPKLTCKRFKLIWNWSEIDLKLTWNWPESDPKLIRKWPEIDPKVTRNWSEINLQLT